MSLTVVIPTFNRSKKLRHTLHALHRQTAGSFDVIVIDNSSTDDTALVIEECRRFYNGRLRYRVKEPKGPASARNLGLAMADSEYILYLDSDVELRPDWINLAILNMERDENLGAVGGQVQYAFNKDLLNAYGGAIGWFGLAWDIMEGENINMAINPEKRIWINCSAMMARTVACRHVKGFDEEFFCCYEDSDIGWKLNLAGWDVKVFPELIAYHNVQPVAGASNPAIVFHYCKNRLRSLLKNTESSLLGPRLFCYAVYTVLDSAVRKPRIPKIQALLWNLSNLRDTLKKRRESQKIRQRSDKEVFGVQGLHWFPPTRLNGQRRRAVKSIDTDGKDLADKKNVDDRI